MAFRRRTKTIGGGVRKTITHNTKTGTTSSSSTKVGRERSTFTILPNGRTRITKAHTSVDGHVTRTSKTSTDNRKKNRPNKTFSQNDAAGLFLLAMIFGGAWVLITYWQWVVAVLVIAVIGWILIKTNKKTEDDAAYEEWLKNKSDK